MVIPMNQSGRYNFRELEMLVIEYLDKKYKSEVKGGGTDSDKIHIGRMSRCCLFCKDWTTEMKTSNGLAEFLFHTLVWGTIAIAGWFTFKIINLISEKP